MSSIVSTPNQRFRKHPKLIKELEAFKRRKWWPEVESNHRHEDFQSSALPTELSGHFELLFCLACFTDRFRQAHIKPKPTLVVKLDLWIRAKHKRCQGSARQASTG